MHGRRGGRASGLTSTGLDGQTDGLRGVAQHCSDGEGGSYCCNSYEQVGTQHCLRCHCCRFALLN